jgi:hypothetical protein
VKGIDFVALHGVSGEESHPTAHLIKEVMEVKGGGVFCSFAKYFGMELSNQEVNLKQVLYNIPFIHRAFTITFKTSPELFIPIKNPHFVKSMKNSESWFCAEIGSQQYQKERVFKDQTGWEVDKGESIFCIRSRKRFKWGGKGITKAENLKALSGYHQKIRQDIKYIQAPQRLWYFKRNDRKQDLLDWPIPLLVYIAMHRLSELCRYDPTRLLRHYRAQHNWLLLEFVNRSLENFIDQIACEISGQYLMCSGVRD